MKSKIRCRKCNEEFNSMTSFINHFCSKENKVKWNAPKKSREIAMLQKNV